MTWSRSLLCGVALGSVIVACGRERGGGDHAGGNGRTSGGRGGDAGRVETSGTSGATTSGGAVWSSTGGEGGRAAASNAGTGGVSAAAGVAGDSTMHAAEGGQGGDADSAGQGAAGGSGGEGEALDPDLPLPTHDCRTDLDDCVSLAGTFDGMPVDVFTDPGQCGAGAAHSGKWAIGCDWLGKASDVHVVLDVPIIAPGSFSGSMGPGDTAIADFQFRAADATTSVALFAGNLLSAEIAGTVVPDASSSLPYRIVSGTFHGVWATPDTSCQSTGGSDCATAELNVTFRSRTRFGTCFSDTECVSPEVCNMVAFYCTSL